MKLKLAALTCFCSSLLVTGSAFALPIVHGVNILNDTSAEYLVDMTNSPTTLDVGDLLRGDIVFDRINSNSYSQELTAQFEVRVKSITGNAVTGWDYTFEANTADGTGEVARLYLDAKSADFHTPSTFTDGSLWATLGITDSNTSWTAHTDTNDIATLLAEIQAGNSNVGLYNYRLDVLQNNTGYVFLDVGATGAQFITAANGSFQDIPTGADPIYGLGDQSSAKVNMVPEPASLALLGFGILGLVGVRRRITK